MKNIKITLKVTIFLALTIILFLTSVILITVSIVMGRSSVNNVLSSLVNNVSISVTEKTMDFLDPAAMVSRTRYFLYNTVNPPSNTGAGKYGPVALKISEYFDPVLLGKYRLTRSSLSVMAGPRMERLKSFIDFSSDMCRNFEQISKIHKTDYRNFDFCMVKKMEDGSLSTTWRLRFIAPTGDSILLTLWDHENRDYYYLPDYANSIVPTGTAFDPRQRPWFSLAVREFEEARAAGRYRHPVWSPAYVFYSDKTPGVTCSIALGREAIDYIYCVDIDIIDISTRYLPGLTVGSNGKVFILNETGEIIAYNPYSESIKDPARRQALAKQELSKIMQQVTKHGDPKDPEKITGYDFQLTSITNSPNELYKVTFEKSGLSAVKYPEKGPEARPEIRLPGPRQFRFSFQDVRYIGSFSPFPVTSKLRWLVGIVIPEDDFMAIAKKNTIILVVVSIIMMALSFMLALWISKSITINLNKLAAETEKIRVFNLDNPVKVQSRLIEIHRMGEAFHNMETGLRSFSKYVPADIVRFMVQSGAEAALGGEKRELTVFFSDIAGFTSISEMLAPDALVRFLGEYLGEMSDIIVANGGTIDKYIGDSVMAFWNAPSACDDHAFLACKTAIECRERLRYLRENKWKENGQPLFESRFGINTGELIVGNMGSEKRLNYTVIGDTVNLASRLEGINKIYGTHMICSENTYRLLGGRIETRILDVVTVKGKKEPIAIYEIIGLADRIPAEVRDFNLKFNEAFDLYSGQHFGNALKVLNELLGNNPGDTAARVLSERCERYVQEPPGPAWNRVFEITEK